MDEPMYTKNIFQAGILLDCIYEYIVLWYHTHIWYVIHMNVPAKEFQISRVPARWSSSLPLPFAPAFKWNSVVCDFREPLNRCQEQNWQAPEDAQFCHRAIMHMVSWTLLLCSIRLGWPFASFCSLFSPLQTFQQFVLAVSDLLDDCIVAVSLLLWTLFVLLLVFVNFLNMKAT